MFGYVIKISNQFVPCDTVLHTGARNSWSKISTSWKTIGVWRWVLLYEGKPKRKSTLKMSLPP